jgi:hypothetical protein
MPPVPPVKRLLAALGVVLGTLVYIWFAAVRAVPRVKQRKAARRAARRFQR